MGQSPHTNPRFRKPASRIQFRVTKTLSQTLDKAALDAIPNADGEIISKGEVARALVEQAAKQLTGRVAWLKAVDPTKEQIELANKAGYELVSTGISSEKMDIDFNGLELNYASVAAVHPWHVIEAMQRGLNILIFEKDKLYIYHGHGLVRKFLL